MASFSLTSIRILRTRLLSNQNHLSFNRACQRRTRPSSSCIHILNQQQRLVSSTRNTFVNAQKDTAAASKANPNNPNTSTTITTETTEASRYVPEVTAQVFTKKVPGPRVETPKISKYRVDGCSPKMSNKVLRRQEEKRKKKVATMASVAAAAIARPPKSVKLRNKIKALSESKIGSKGNPESIYNNARGSKAKEDRGSEKEVKSSTPSRETTVRIRDDSKAIPFRSTPVSKRVDLIPRPAIRPSSSTMYSNTASAVETETRKVIDRAPPIITPFQSPSPSPSPSSSPSPSVISSTPLENAHVKRLQAEDSARRVIESSVMSHKHSPSQTPSNVDRGIYRTILDWSVHPTVQPDDFNILSEAQRTMVRITRLASANRSSPPKSSNSSGTSPAPSSSVFQWPHRSDDDAQKEKVSIKEVYSPQKSYGSNPTQERSSERRVWTFDSESTDSSLEKAVQQSGRDHDGGRNHDEKRDHDERRDYDGRRDHSGERDRDGSREEFIEKKYVNDYLYSPLVVFAAINSKARMLFRLYYSDNPPAQDTDLGSFIKPTVDDCVKAARNAGLRTIKVDQRKLDDIASNNKGIVLVASKLHSYPAIGLGPVSEKNEYQLHFRKMPRRYNFKCPSGSGSTFRSKGSSLSTPLATPEMLETEPTKRHPLWVVIDKVQDPYIMGQIIRTASYFGVDGIIYRRTKCYPATADVAAASEGAMEQQLIYSTHDTTKFFELSKKNGWDVIGIHMARKLPKTTFYHEWPKGGITKPTLLVVSEEGGNLSKSVASQCCALFDIPRLSPAGSAVDYMSGDVALALALDKLVNKKSGL
ncbi:hypothetical protein BGZ46_001536 [Entomortierella lignicola]|nr:hypothetical protein BGZ46_001536 [Entomortierella lignicola]